MQQMSKAWALVIAAGAVLAAAPTAAQDWKTIHIRKQFTGQDLLRVSVEYGAGQLSISPGPANTLFSGLLRYDGSTFKPLNEYDDGHLRIGIQGGSIKGRNMKAGKLDLTLSPSVPLDLQLKFGAAQADLELGGLRVKSLSIQTGASETNVRVSKPNREACSSASFEVGAASFHATGLGNLNCQDFRVAGGVGEVVLDFSGEFRNDINADVDMGLGSLVLRVPRGLGVSVRKSGVLASFDSQGLVKRGNVYYSENFEKAEHKLTIQIDAALGSIKVQWVDGGLGSR